MAVDLQRQWLKDDPARLCVCELVRMQLRAILCPVPELAAVEAGRRVWAICGVVPTLFAIAADNLSAVTRPVPKEPAPKAFVRWASLPAAPAVSCGFSCWAFVGTAVVVAVLWWENEDVVRLNHDWRSAAFELDRHALVWRWRRAQDDATPTVELVAQERVQLHAAGANEAAQWGVPALEDCMKLQRGRLRLIVITEVLREVVK